MKSHKTLTTIVAAAGLLISGAANAAILINEYPNSTTSNIGTTASNASGGDAINTLITNSRFAPNTLNDPTDGEFADNTQGGWRVGSGLTTADQWIQWDLGSSFQLDTIRGWNFNDDFRFASGIRRVDIFFSNVASPGDPEIAGVGNGDNWTHWTGGEVILPAAPGEPAYTGFDLETTVGSTLPTGEFRFVRFEVNSTFVGDGITLPTNDRGVNGSNGGDQASFGQIEFYQVPEPSTALLGAFGFLALLRRRRA